MAEGILREILAQPDRTPPHLLVSLSWGLACTVQRDPPFTAGFAGSRYPDPCKRYTAAGCDPKSFRVDSITREDGKAAASFIEHYWELPEAAAWKRKLAGDGVLTPPLGVTGPGFFPAAICTVCSQLRTGIGKPKGGVIDQRGQVSRHESKNTHKAAAAASFRGTSWVRLWRFRPRRRQ